MNWLEARMCSLLIKDGFVLSKFDCTIINIKSRKFFSKVLFKFLRTSVVFKFLMWKHKCEYLYFIKCNTFISSSCKFHLKLLKLNKSYLNNHQGLWESNYMFTCAYPVHVGSVSSIVSHYPDNLKKEKDKQPINTCTHIHPG